MAENQSISESGHKQRVYTTYMDCRHCGNPCLRKSPSQKYCDECRAVCIANNKRDQDKKYSDQNRDKINTYARDRHHRLREVLLPKMKERRSENIDAIRLADKSRYAQNKGPRLKSAKEYYERNREQIIEKNRSPEAREKARSYEREKRKSNPAFRAHSNMSSYIRKSIRDKKSRPWEQLLGYTTSDLMGHIERQFAPGMTWDNYSPSGWHIDHIVPLASFNFETDADPDFKAAWALTNLRPLWAKDNLKKSDQRIFLI